MDFLSASLCLKNRKCLVIGSQPQAISIAQELSNRHAHVVIISPQPVSLADGIIVFQRDFEAADLDECWLVFAAGQSVADNNAVKQLCDERQLFCSIIGDESNSTCVVSDLPSIVSPSFMPSVTQATTLATTSAGIPESLSENAVEKANSVTQKSTDDIKFGIVSLVGAGPGDPELLTVRALSRIQHADAVVYDRLVSKPILELCNPNAEFVYAGKAKANHALPQNSINELLVELARKYQRVVRLKGGDPFIFGRGGEEIETLADEKVAFEVVPGITAASGCAAFSGIPLTHRDHAQSCIFVTGHLRNGTINLNWQELTDPQRTIVVYMGLTGLDAICESLIKHGRSTQTPAALIEQGTKPQQRVLASTLSDLPELVEKSDVTAPTLLIIGDVVSLRDKLKWF